MLDTLPTIRIQLADDLPSRAGKEPRAAETVSRETAIGSRIVCRRQRLDTGHWSQRDRSCSNARFPPPGSCSGHVII
jgi:hypothetical protein